MGLFVWAVQKKVITQPGTPGLEALVPYLIALAGIFLLSPCLVVAVILGFRSRCRFALFWTLPSLILFVMHAFVIHLAMFLAAIGIR